MGDTGSYKIGEYTVAYDATITGAITHAMTVPDDVFYNSEGTGFGYYRSGSLFNAEWSIFSRNQSSGSAADLAQLVLTVSGIGDSDTYSNLAMAFSSSFAGSVAVSSVVCDIMMTIVGNGDSTPPEDAFRHSIPDAGFERWVSFTLVPQPNQDYTVTATMLGQTVTANCNTGATPAAIPVTVQAWLYLKTNRFVVTFPPSPPAPAPVYDTTSGSYSMTFDTPPSGSSLAGVSCGSVSGPASADASGSAGTITLAAVAQKSGFNEAAIAEVFITTAPDRAIDYAAVTRAMEDAYPQSLTASLSGLGTPTTEAFTASLSRSYTQKQASFTANTRAKGSSNAGGEALDTDTDTESIDTYAAVEGSITSTSLSAIGEAADGRRLAIRGRAWDAMSLGQDASVTVDDGTTLAPTGSFEGDWTGTGDVAPSIVAGAVQAASAGGAGTLARSFDEARTFSPYRYLRVRCRSLTTGTQPLTLTIGGKSWSLTTGAADTWTDVDVDLCADDSASTVSTEDTEWPLDYAPSDTPSPTGTKLPVSDSGAYYGVGKLTGLTLEGLAAGITYEIDAITLRRDSYSRASFLQSLSWWQTLYPQELISEAGVTTDHYGTRFLLGDTDGRQSLEMLALRRQDTYSPALGTTTVTYFLESILTLINAINETNADGAILHPGWVAVDLEPESGACASLHPPADACYWNSNLPAGYLWGAGALWRTGAWSYGFDKDVSSPLTIPACPIYDKVLSWVGDLGDLLYGTTTTGSLVIRAAQILRGQAHGLVYDETKLPEAAVTVEVRDSGAVLAGDASSAANGAYQSDLNYAKPPGNSHTVQAMSGTNPAGSVAFYSRKRHRVVFVIGETGDIITVDTSPTGRTTYAGVQGGVVIVHNSINWQTTAWGDINTGITGEVPCARYEWGGHRLWLSYLDGTTVKRVYSDDGGGSWSVAVTIATGASQQAFAVAPTGWQLHIWRDGATIKARAYDAFGTALWAAVTAVASAVEDAGIGITYDSSAQRWYILYRNTSGNVITVTSNDGGLTWA